MRSQAKKETVVARRRVSPHIGGQNKCYSSAHPSEPVSATTVAVASAVAMTGMRGLSGSLTMRNILGSRGLDAHSLNEFGGGGGGILFRPLSLSIGRYEYTAESISSLFAAICGKDAQLKNFFKNGQSMVIPGNDCQGL
eukprot:Trichotokara_eunicae@DN7789_c0_g1_i1.p1